MCAQKWSKLNFLWHITVFNKYQIWRKMAPLTPATVQQKQRGKNTTYTSSYTSLKKGIPGPDINHVENHHSHVTFLCRCLGKARTYNNAFHTDAKNTFFNSKNMSIYTTHRSSFGQGPKLLWPVLSSQQIGRQRVVISKKRGLDFFLLKWGYILV